MTPCLHSGKIGIGVNAPVPSLFREVLSMWRQSNNGTWHRQGGYGHNDLPKCQSYNLDRPNTLHGQAVSAPPEGAKVCKKCLTH